MGYVSFDKMAHVGEGNCEIIDNLYHGPMPPAKRCGQDVKGGSVSVDNANYINMLNIVIDWHVYCLMLGRKNKERR